MPLYLAVPRNQNAAASLEERVREKYDESSTLKLDLGAWIISVSETAGEVTKKLEIIEGNRPLSAIIFGLTGTYSGRAPSPVWDWLKVAIERQANG